MSARRSLQHRITAAKQRIANTHRLWLATGNTEGPHLIPVAFVRDGGQVVTATAARSRTVTNLRDTQRARLGLGTTDDVVMVDAHLDALVQPSDMHSSVADRFAEVSHDPRRIPGYLFIRLSPQRMQVWNSFEEFRGRTAMRNGKWLAEPID